KKYLNKDDYNFISGYTNYLQKNYEISKKYLEKIKNNSAIYRDGAIILSKIYLEEKKIEDAIRILDNINNKDNVIYYNLAYLSLLKNELKLAVKYAENIEKLELDEQIVLFKSILLKTRIYVENEDYYSGLKEINRISQYPYLQDTYLYNLLIIKHKLLSDDNLIEYKKIIDELNKNKGKYPDLLYKLMFIILYFEKYYDLAIDFYENTKEIILKDDYEKYIIITADLYNKKGIYKKTIELLNYNILSSLSENYFKIAFNYFYEGMLAEKKYDQFFDICKNLLKIRNEKDLILNLLVENFITIQRYDEGIQYLLSIKSYKSYPPYFYLLLAKLYIAKKDITNAYLNLKIVEKMDLKEYNRDEIYIFMAKYYLMIKKLDDFKNLFSLISEKEKNKSENFLLFLEYYYKSGNYNEIIKLEEIINQEYLKDRLVLFYLAKAFYKNKNYEKAIIYFSKLLEKTERPDEKAIYAIYLGNCYAYIDNLSSAYLYYKEAEIWDKNQSYSLVNRQILEKVTTKKGK
ncbi:MAG: tetratricopeptide repeat protein, partial [Exilispira sp.]